MTMHFGAFFLDDKSQLSKYNFIFFCSYKCICYCVKIEIRSNLVPSFNFVKIDTTFWTFSKVSKTSFRNETNIYKSSKSISKDCIFILKKIWIA